MTSAIDEIIEEEGRYRDQRKYIGKKELYLKAQEEKDSSTKFKVYFKSVRRSQPDFSSPKPMVVHKLQTKLRRIK